MSGRIVDATLVAAPRQRDKDAEKVRIKAGETAAEIWPEKPAKARQKDVDARWTVKFSKAKPAAGGAPRIDIAIPAFGYKRHISIDRRNGVIRHGKVTDALGAAPRTGGGSGPSPHDGARLREGLIDPNNTSSDVWADSAYRSAETERFLARIGRVSRIHRGKPKGRPMPRRTARANATRSAVRAFVEHPFAHQKGPMGLVIRTIGIARATAAVKYALKWTRLSCMRFAANAVRLQLHALAYNLANFLRTLATPEAIETWSLTGLRERLIKIGARLVRHARYAVSQLAEAALPRAVFAGILDLINGLRGSPVGAASV